MILVGLTEPGLLKSILNITLYAKINSFIYIALMMVFSVRFIYKRQLEKNVFSGRTAQFNPTRHSLVLSVF